MSYVKLYNFIKQFVGLILKNYSYTYIKLAAVKNTTSSY